MRRAFKSGQMGDFFQIFQEHLNKPRDDFHTWLDNQWSDYVTSRKHKSTLKDWEYPRFLKEKTIEYNKKKIFEHRVKTFKRIDEESAARRKEASFDFLLEKLPLDVMPYLEMPSDKLNKLEKNLYTPRVHFEEPDKSVSIVTETAIVPFKKQKIDHEPTINVDQEFIDHELEMAAMQVEHEYTYALKRQLADLSVLPEHIDNHGRELKIIHGQHMVTYDEAGHLHSMKPFKKLRYS